MPEIQLENSYNQLFFMKLTLGEIPIDPQNVNYVIIREWIISLMPTIQISINDDGMLSEIFQLQDEMKIELLLGKTPDDENPLKVNFMLMDYSMGISTNNNYGIVELTGVLDIPLLFSPLQNRSFSNKSSKNVLSTIASKDSFETNFSSTWNPTDVMTWIQSNQTDYEFIQHIAERSFVKDDASIMYFDSTGILNATTLNTIINKKDKKIARYDTEKFVKMSFDNDEDKNTIWFNYYDLLNMNGYYNKINNYGVKIVYHDLSDSVTKDIKFDSSQLAERTFKNKNRVNRITNKQTFGSLNNTHSNYHLALVQNQSRIMNLMGFSMVMNINSLSNVKLADLISVNIPQMVTYAQEGPNLQLSGRYVVVGKTYTATKNNIFRKQLIVARDGYNESGYNTGVNITNK